jgi:hypothetical protein
MVFYQAFSQIGALPYLFALIGFNSLYRLCRHRKPLSKSDTWGVFILSTTVPVFLTALMASLGNPSILADSSLGTYLFLNTFIVLFFLLFWTLVIAKEGWGSRTLFSLFDDRSVPPFIILRILIMCLLIGGIALLYEPLANFVMKSGPCHGRRCQYGEAMIATRGTILGPLFACSFFSSIGIGLLSAWLVRAVGFFWARSKVRRSDENANVPPE